MRRLVLLATLFLAALPSAVWAQLRAGAEFQVNTYTTSFQMHPAVASDVNGNFVVVWDGIGGQDGDGGVFGRRFQASGAPLGVEFQVNSYTTNSQLNAVVAADASGSFVVVWQDNGHHDGSGYGVFGKRFDAAGVPQGAEFQVNSYTTDFQLLPAVASQANGFVVVWQSNLQDGSGYGIFGRRFDSSGVPKGTEFKVNSFTTDYQGRPAVASDASGNLVVVWQGGASQDGSGYGIFGRRFNAAGVPQGAEFRVNSYSTGYQGRPAVASDTSGNFVVAWRSFGQDGDGVGIFGRRFDAAGVPQGAEFQVNSYTTSGQTSASVTSDAHGDFVIVWHSDGQDGSGDGIFGRRFSGSGAPLGSEFRVNTYTPGYQRFPVVASDSDGDFVVVWQGGASQDGSAYGIFGQRYGDLIFEDGFDSGDLTHWSSASTDGGDLTVSATAAMAGTVSGLEAFVNDANSLYVVDETPNSENRYRARFYFDPNGFDPGEASAHFRARILIAFDPSGLRVITLVLKSQGGAYSVEARVRRNDGTRADTGFFPINDGPHFIEFDWLRATGPGAGNGSLQLWIDSVPVATLGVIDNDLSAVDSVRLGALAIKTGAAGTLFFDQFESRRQTFIGPE